MSETPRPTKEKQEAYQAFIRHYSLDPSNNDAIMNCLFEMSQKIDKKVDSAVFGRTEGEERRACQV